MALDLLIVVRPTEYALADAAMFTAGVAASFRADFLQRVPESAVGAGGELLLTRPVQPIRQRLRPCDKGLEDRFQLRWSPVSNKLMALDLAAHPGNVAVVVRIAAPDGLERLVFEKRPEEINAYGPAGIVEGSDLDAEAMFPIADALGAVLELEVVERGHWRHSTRLWSAAPAGPGGSVIPRRRRVVLPRGMDTDSRESAPRARSGGPVD